MTLDDHRQTSDWRRPESRHPGMAAPGMAALRNGGPPEWRTQTAIATKQFKMGEIGRLTFIHRLGIPKQSRISQF